MNTQENQISYTLPENWTDLDKLYLCYKVLMHDGVFSRASSYKNYDEANLQLMANIFTAVEQALITCPPHDKGDIYTKVQFMQELLKSNHLDNNNEIIPESISGTELGALEIARQLEKAIDNNLTPDQRKHKEAIHHTTLDNTLDA